MLELNNIKRSYIIGSDIHRILKGITVKFKKDEFVSIIGPSGSGKTTLLNIIGGLEYPDSGDIIINGVSIKRFEDDKLASYRNYKIGFIFKEHNLIMHESILENVSLALMFSKLSKKEIKNKAIEALDAVGLKAYINKRPIELSALQMKEVAVARAIVSNPEIILVDEATGMLNSKDSIELINVLKKVSKDKIVIMTTSDNELAKEYSTRVIEMKDGMITDDTESISKDKKRGRKKKVEQVEVEDKENIKYKSSIPFTKSLSLSFNSILMKKGKTLFTVFASSFGIAFIALIFSLFNGVHNYAKRLEVDDVSNYPIKIEKVSYDVYGKSIIDLSDKIKCEDEKLCSNDNIFDDVFKDKVVSNNIKEFKGYVETKENFASYTDNIIYEYDIEPQIYTKDYKKVNPSNIKDEVVFKEMNVNTSTYKLLAGKIPDDYHELILVVGNDRNISDSILYALNIKDRKILSEDITKYSKDSSYKPEDKVYSYEDILNKEYRLLLNTDYYVEKAGKFIDYSNDVSYIKDKINNATKLKIVGIAISDKATTPYIGYTHDLTLSLRYKISNTSLYKKQVSNKKINALTGEEFDGINNTYELVTKKLGIYEEGDALSLSIYPKDADSKKEIIKLIDEYNSEKRNANKEKMMISYNDTIKTSVNNVYKNIIFVSCVLCVLVIVGLIISSIMIKLRTNYSILFRSKEFAMLKVLGASRKDIRNLIISEVMIEGVISGIIGVGISMLISIPINILVNKYTLINHISNMSLIGFIVLVIVNVLLSVVAVLLVANKASKRSPLEALKIGM